ncbi:M48 family metallopeptidase [Panacibacter ginsenosidivorans]|uniref:M48 family metallopeptidase n=1 Tax=Panacibacter ginsenosidivorans TaxID=1813871 RepID=A0A5B8VAC8_9BACT|nr:M48 family metallopeptidase [Panacibacter ginsenosidivorans]QEC68450.1 M48 family metallopeptidase [Panacibacter ginsenosidivorans]
MRYKIVGLLALPFIINSSCTHNAITGRNQLTLVSEEQVETTAVTEYKSFLSKSKVVSSTGSKDAEMVNRVGTRIANAINEYYKTKGLTNELANYKWEFNLVDSKEVNAWCMPGGKVVVYTGILPVTQNEAALAVVLGHEITHAVAGHGRERMSQSMLAQGIQIAGNVALGRDPKTLNIFNNVYGPAAQVGVLLPNSRNQEYEADHYGLIFAAMAGYNPQEAIPFWQRMAKMGGEKPPVFLSSHPADEDRIKKLQELMPEALTYYKPVSK